MTAILKITDGTDEISLLRGEDGFALENWTPAVAGYKAGGVFQESPLSDGRRLVSAVFNNVLETFSLKITADSMDEAITVTQNLRRLLQKAVQYWTTDWQNELVWIEAQATCESNLRYAIIQSYTAPQDDNPFAQPFLQSQKRAVMDEWTLVIERQHWLADQPGTGTCVETSGTSDSFCYPHYLEFNGDTSEIDCSLGNGLDDLMDNAFTVEAWVRADSLGEADEGAIASKGGFLTEGWVFYMLGGVVPAAVTDAESFPLIGYLDILDGDWHHVAMTFDDAGDRRIDLFIDGVEVAYASHDAAVGAVINDGAETFRIGNVDDGSRGFDGDIGWVRVSDSVRYTATFTPPLRCVIPSADANTLAIWIREGSGTAIDNAEGTASRDGTASNTSWNCDCANLFGRAATCLNEVYIANKQNLAQLTHIFVDDGGVFGGNLIGAATPFDLLPAVPLANDAVYFGIDTAAADSGPFCSLVFDIGTAITGVTGTAWEYWNGAWTGLTEQDNTDAAGAGTGVAFDTTGVGSVHWVQESDWATTAVNGVTGYWVRLRVTIAAGATAPTQQNRDVYTITWPSIDIDDAQVGGDIAALLRLYAYNQNSTQAGGIAVTRRVIAGLRSASRGAGFVPYINLADEQNPSGITISVAGGGAFATDTRTPSGRAIQDSNVNANYSTVAIVSLDSTISPDFYGAFHCFVRMETDGTPTDSAARWRQFFGDGASRRIFNTGPGQYLAIQDEFELVDLGKIVFQGTSLLNDDDVYVNLGIEIQTINTSGDNHTLVDVIFIPVDEWAIDTFRSDSAVLNGRYLDIDSIARPKSYIRSINRVASSATVISTWEMITNGQPILQANADQKLHFAIADTNEQSTHTADVELAHSIQLFGQSRYLSMRGAR